MQSISLAERWRPSRPHVLVVACSDGRLQEATDEFLDRALGVRQYDRLYAPGGAGALASSGRDFMRAQAWRRECRFLVEAHQVEHLVLLFHGPAVDGPLAAVCADYRRKHPWATAAQLRERQEQDVGDLLERRDEFTGETHVSIFRFEVDSDASVTVVTLYADPGALADDSSGDATPP
ncbi:MAG TPA: hypothetical protein VK922_13285 [Gemmatimonadaceae bacterium]|nr:hypothetical protein [Gemmatimonadaceae bacterium]